MLLSPEILLVVLGCLLPLTFYCLYLCCINSLRQSFIVSGSWDFVGILFAAAGFLLLAGPIILGNLQQTIVSAGGRKQGLLDSLLWGILALLYIILVVSATAWALWRRRWLTLIYNVD